MHLCKYVWIPMNVLNFNCVCKSCTVSTHSLRREEQNFHWPSQSGLKKSYYNWTRNSPINTFKNGKQTNKQKKMHQLVPQTYLFQSLQRQCKTNPTAWKLKGKVTHCGRWDHLTVLAYNRCIQVGNWHCLNHQEKHKWEKLWAVTNCGMPILRDE